MRIRLLASVAAIALMTIPGNLAGSLPSIVPAAQAQGTEVSISVFYDGLRDHGRWVNHSRHKYVWVPVDVDPDWRPYSRGHWIYTERYGWYFASDEPFAWAAYHYGRWAFDGDIGWYWVPGRVWGPAWVTWRRGGDHLGWAPLPPEGDSVVVGVEVSREEPPLGYWVFVPSREFLAPDLTVVIVERQEIAVIYERTEFVGPVVVENNVVVNTTIDIDYIRETTGQEVQVTEVEVVQDPAAARQAGDAVVAVEGEIAVEEGAAPEETVEAEKVDAPTSQQQVETSGADSGQDGEAPAAQGEQPAEQPTEAQDGQSEQAPEADTGAGTAGQTQPDDADQPAAESQAGEPVDEEAGKDGEQPEAGEGAAAKQDRVPAEQPAEGTPETEEAPATEESTQEDAGEAEEQPAESQQQQPAESQQGEQPAQGQQQEQPAESQDQGEQPAQEEPAESQPAPDQQQDGRAESQQSEQPAESQQGEQPAESQQGEQPAPEEPSGECSDEDRAAGRCQ